MKLKYIVLGILNIASLLLFAAASAFAAGIGNSLPDQKAVERWASAGELPYAQVSVFADEYSALDINKVFTARVDIDKKLIENSAASEDKDARVWADAFSATQEKLSISSDRFSAEANMIVTGGDFFLFHPQDIISGYYYSDNDIMQDRVLIDNVLAWQLYGSSDVAGKPVVIDGKYFYISGVFRQSENSYIKKVYGASPRIFMSYEGYGLLDKEAKFTCYEACLPNQVTGQAKQILTEALSIKEDDLDFRVVENSLRYSLKNRFGIIADFGMRSVVDRPIVYPFWENAARLTEDKSALVLAFQIIFLLLPIGTAVYLIAKLYRSRKKLFKKALNAAKAFFDRIAAKLRDRKNSKKGLVKSE